MYSCLELFSGIGGFSVAAARLGWTVLHACDIDQRAAQVYRQNFAHVHQVRTIESIPFDELAAVGADVWWMSPPCQPFTRRGVRRDLADPRCEAFLHLVEAISVVQPRSIAMENVPGFAVSAAANHLRATLTSCDYHFTEFQLCPTQLGIPNRRRRFYLAASKEHLRTPPQRELPQQSLASYLDQFPADELNVPQTTLSRFATVIDCVDPLDHLAIASCFTSAYGKSPAQSGSYLRTNGSLRRFASQEILNLLGFPNSFRIPDDLTLRQQWKLVGNSLSIPTVEHCLRHL